MDLVTINVSIYHTHIISTKSAGECCGITNRCTRTKPCGFCRWTSYVVPPGRPIIMSNFKKAILWGVICGVIGTLDTWKAFSLFHWQEYGWLAFFTLPASPLVRFGLDYIPFPKNSSPLLFNGMIFVAFFLTWLVIGYSVERFWISRFSRKLIGYSTFILGYLVLAMIGIFLFP